MAALSQRPAVREMFVVFRPQLFRIQTAHKPFHLIAARIGDDFAGHLSGIVPAHAVGDHVQAHFVIIKKGILVPLALLPHIRNACRLDNDHRTTLIRFVISSKLAVPWLNLIYLST